MGMHQGTASSGGLRDAPGHTNHSITPSPCTRGTQAETRRAAAVAELESKGNSLFERLRAVANGNGNGNGAAARSSSNGAPPPPAAAAAAAAAPPPPVAAPAPAAQPAVAGALGGAPVDLAKEAERYRAAYAQQFGQMYLLDKQMFLNRSATLLSCLCFATRRQGAL